MAQDMATPGQTPTEGQAFVNVVKPPLEGVVYACPCCMEQTLAQRGAGEKCLLCYWCDDGQDDHDADVVRGTVNGDISLTKGRENFIALGICRPDLAPEQFDLPVASEPPPPPPPPKPRTGMRVAAVAGVLAILGGVGLWWRPWAPRESPPPPVLPPKGQDTPEQTVSKFLAALARGHKRPFMECLTGPHRAVEPLQRMFDASLAWDKFRQAVESNYGYPAWQGAVEAAGVRIVSRHWYCRRGDYAQLRLIDATDDRASVAVRFTALGTTGTVFLEKAAGLWWIDATRPVFTADDRDLRAAQRAIERLPGLQAKVGRKGFSARRLREELAAIFADVAYLEGPALTGARPRINGGAPSLTIAVLPGAEGQARYRVEERTMSLEDVADLLAELVGRHDRLEVQIQFDSRYPLEPATRLEEVCRAVGVARTGMLPMVTQPAATSQPGS